MTTALDIKASYVRTGEPFGPETSYRMIRSDAGEFLKGRVASENLTGLSATFTARMVMPDGSTGPAVITKLSSAIDEIAITENNVAVNTLTVFLKSSDTSGFEPGQRFRCDLEVRTSTTPPTVYTLKSSFSIEEDYTLNSVSPSPSPAP